VTETPPEEPLAPTPARSTWGRNAARIYLVAVAIAALVLARELVVGRSGPGVLAISVLTAPWSGLLAGLARTLAGRMDPAALRALGLVLAALAALLNARILYGIAARAERDVRGATGAPR
jgi:hypothetical protein